MHAYGHDHVIAIYVASYIAIYSKIRVLWHLEVLIAI